MSDYSNLIIGFGKAGKTLAKTLATRGESTMVVEKDASRYGGTCINVACIPTKILEHKARERRSDDDAAAWYANAVTEKNAKTAALRAANYKMLIDAGVAVENAAASFVDEHTVRLAYIDGHSRNVTADRIYINTGSYSFVPELPGIKDNRYIYTSTSLMDRTELPKSLVIVGGGYIGLEFASYYRNFGSEVTLLHKGSDFIPREDKDITAAVIESFEKRGIKIVFNSDVLGFDGPNVNYSVNGEKQTIKADAILIAIGRRANTRGLELQNAGVNLNSRGEIAVDENLRTSQKNIFAMGDVKGGLQFTYISLDDFRILTQNGRTTANRGAIPYTIFLDPPVSRVGLSESEARNAGFDVKVKLLPANKIPKTLILEKRDGVLKAIVDNATGQILGAHLFCANSEEVINLIKLAMDMKVPYTHLLDSIFNHPTVTEGLNDLFAI
jgi:pyruvate/2-oxoglutarate dehydrogenase complex dihydrolipoamide dehydrogenase (E3) component